MNTRNLTTIARPYANAAFEYALANNSVAAWDSFLQFAAAIVQDENVNTLLTNPTMTARQLGDLLCDLLSAGLDASQENFIRLLADNHRLAALPEITQLFKEHREAQEKTLSVRVTSAVPLSADYQKLLQETLTKRFARKVSMQCELDPDVLGGAIIYAGDKVIDGSVRGKLNRLMEFIS